MELAEDHIQCLYLALSVSILWDLAQERKFSESRQSTHAQYVNTLF